MKKRILSTDYQELEYNLTDVQLLLDIISEDITVANVDDADGQARVKIFMTRLDNYCAMLNGASKILQDVIDRVAATIEEQEVAA